MKCLRSCSAFACCIAAAPTLECKDHIDVTNWWWLVALYMYLWQNKDRKFKVTDDMRAVIREKLSRSPAQTGT